MKQGGKRNTIKMYHLTPKRRKERKMKKATRRQTPTNKRNPLNDTCHPASDFPEEARQLTEENDQKAQYFQEFLYSVSRLPYCVERLPYCATRQPYCIYKSPYFIRHLSYKSHPYKPIQRIHNKETISLNNALFQTVHKQVGFQSILELIELRTYLQYTGAILHYIYVLKEISHSSIWPFEKEMVTSRPIRKLSESPTKREDPRAMAN